MIMTVLRIVGCILISLVCLLGIFVWVRQYLKEWKCKRNDHDWDKCTCTRCGKITHEWKLDECGDCEEKVECLSECDNCLQKGEFCEIHARTVEKCWRCGEERCY